MNSVLTKNQRQTKSKQYTENKLRYKIEVTLRYDDECNNGHNSFAITCSIYEKTIRGWREYIGGCCHDEITKHFPEFKPLIKWHLCSSDGPLHYIANTTYHASNKDLSAARSCASWPEATDDELMANDLNERLVERLPALLIAFEQAMTDLGFVY